MTPIIYLPEAQDDIDTAYANYNARSAGLGDRFLNDLRRALGLIGSFPDLYGEVAAGIRAGTLRRFPYVVYYQTRPDVSLVIAVRHGRDDPSVWQGRA